VDRRASTSRLGDAAESLGSESCSNAPATARLSGIVRMAYLPEKCVMFRTTYLRTISLALAAAGCMAQATAAPSACVGLAGTADGFKKDVAVSRAQGALDDYINQYKTENNLDAVTIRPMRAEPQPYWRRRVSENMMHQPDIVTATSYTICWQGVISFFVCTSGAQVCW
jgi:hypothetical protein